MSPAEAMERSGGIFVVMRITATLWTVTVISFFDRIDRVPFMPVASALALVGQVAPARGRGAVIGVFTLYRSIGMFWPPSSAARCSMSGDRPRPTSSRLPERSVVPDAGVWVEPGAYGRRCLTDPDFRGSGEKCDVLPG